MKPDAPLGWSCAQAVHAGKDRKRCGDFSACKVAGDAIVAAVADGAGTAEAGHQGAALACEAFLELGRRIYERALDPSCLVAALQDRIPSQERDAHSATLIGVAADSKGALVLQIGDGAAVFRRASAPGFEVAIWPEETEFLNHTFFATSPDAEQHLQVRRIEEPIEAFALFTDGLQHLVVDPECRAPHQPFFESVLNSLGPQSGPDPRASAWLATMLASEPVTRRTFDDTGIVIGRWRPC